MSLDIFDSKQVIINCTSLNADAASISGSVSMGSSIVNGNLDVNGYLYFDTVSDGSYIEHIKDGDALTTVISNDKKEYVIDEEYTIGDIVKITLDIGIPPVQVYDLHYLCTVNTDNSPPNAPWTYIGTLFSDTQAYPAAITNVIYNGRSYNALVANGPGGFNPADWTINGLAPSTIGDNNICRQTIDSSGCSITLGTNSKDFTGMLKLVSKNTAVSEIQSLTGNIVLNRPILGSSTPADYNDKTSMYYDASGDFVIVLSRDDDTHYNGFGFVSHTVSVANNKPLLLLSQTIITEPGPVVKRYGNVNTDIVNAYGLNLSPLTVPVGYETCGTATLVAGTVTVATNACGPNSKIFLTLTTNSTHNLYISSRTQTNFTVLSTSAGDTATFDWMLINPDFSV